MATHHGRPGNLTRWTAERDKLYHQIMARGWNPQKGAFTQHYDTDVLDASQSATPTIDLAATPGDSGGYEEGGEEKDTMTRAGHTFITVAPACHQPR